MNKKYVTIFLIIAGVTFVIMIIVGLLAKTPSGESGYRAIVDSWLNRNNQLATVDQGSSNIPASTQQSPSQQTKDHDSNPSQATATNDSPSTPSSANRSSSSSTSSSTTSSTPTPKPVPNPTPNPTPKPNPNPTPPPSTCKAGGACTSAEVATHTAQSSCWVIYGTKIYNITPFIPKHPKNYGPIIFTTSVCGHDVTPYLTGAASSGGVKKHDHKSEAYTTLNTYWYANLK